MTSGIVVDDHLLLRILLDDEPGDLRPPGAPVSTTGLWYHRLARALADPTVTGTMSRRLGDVEPSVARRAIAAVASLPEGIGLISLRSLAWPMAQLIADGVHLNVMSLEALAAAHHLEAELCLAAADDNAPLRTAAARRDIPIRFIPA